MRRIQKALDVIAVLLLWIGAITMILMMLQIMGEVILRTFFRRTIPGTEEIVSAYYMIGCAFLPLAWVQRSRGHVMVTVFTMWLRPRPAAALDAFAYLVCAVATGIYAYAGLHEALAMTREGEILIGTMDVVVWPSRWFVPLGLVGMLFYLVLQAVADLTWAVKGGEPRLAPVTSEH